jgi:hypothetical protein
LGRSAVSYQPSALSNQVFFVLKLTLIALKRREDTESLARGIGRFGRHASSLALSSGLLRDFVQLLLLL